MWGWHWKGCIEWNLLSKLAKNVIFRAKIDQETPCAQTFLQIWYLPQMKIPFGHSKVEKLLRNQGFYPQNLADFSQNLKI